MRWLCFSSFYIICLPKILKNLTLIVCLLGGLFGYFISNISLNFFNKSLKFYNISFFYRSIWFLPFLSTLGINKFPLLLGFKTLKIFDQG